MGTGRRCINALGESEFEGGTGVVDPVTLLLVEGGEGVEEVNGSFVRLESSGRARRSREGAIWRGRTVFHWWLLREGDVYGY